MVTLNPAQQEAVTAPDGPALVLAGAGSGKTRVIVERLVWLIEERGVDQRNLLGLTFTNRAADEMRQRVATRLGVDRVGIWLGTFHSFGLYILRREIDRLGRPKTFTIFDDSDQLSLIKRLLKNLPPAQAKVSPREALEWISGFKQDLEEPDLTSPAETPEDETCRILSVKYHEALAASGALDFDDLLVCLATLLRDHADVREKYQRRYRYVLIDEYQDTNRVQYQIARLLAGDGGNLFAVGDEDQSIYAWRGADIRNILEFEKDFPGARTYRLEQNYRSTAPILNAANAVVAHNRYRLGKTLRTDQQAGDRVRFYLATDGEDEARFVIEDFQAGGIPAQEVAILYRTNGQARVVEEVLRRKGIPYVIVGGIRFYSRKEIKDILCYLRLLVNPADDESVRRVLNVPPRGIGGVTMERFEHYAEMRQVPLLQVLRDVEHDQTLTPRAREAASGFVHLIDDLALTAKASPLVPAVEALLEKTQYREFVRASDEKDFRSRIEIIDEFLAGCRDFDKNGSGGLLEFLQDLALLSDVDEWRGDTPTVTLMTCHSAKGLEFDAVYLIGLEEGLLPHAMTRHADREVEEERRLCYVAMTRARKRLTLSAAENRFLYGDSESREVSRFVREIPRDQLQMVKRGGEQRESVPAPMTVSPDRIRLGTRVRHPKFGEGAVSYVVGSGKNLKARIRFKTGRVGTFLIDKTPLEIIE